MSQYHGRVPFAKPVDLSYKGSMDAPEKVGVWSEDPIQDTLTRRRPKSYREQVLEKDNDRRLQQIVQQVASRYIRRPD